jgi:8-hydroxy-5-deazaflavin:NADPH oxidoreductase
MATIGVLGTGRMGVRLAGAFANLGHTVVLGSRSAARAREAATAIGHPRVVPGTYDAAIDAPVVLPAIFLRDGLVEALGSYADRLRGKLYIDITNPYNEDYSDFILPWGTSGAERVQEAFPGARVVGAFKNVWWAVLDEPLFAGVPNDVFVVADDEGAKREFLGLVEGMPFRFVDAGRLSNARTVERMTLFLGELGARYGTAPRMGYKFLDAAPRP